jgi:hypothetical protein
MQANVDGWVPSSNNVNTGIGNYGSCCAEMDIWEANSISTAFTHTPATTPNKQNVQVMLAAVHIPMTAMAELLTQTGVTLTPTAWATTLSTGPA